jgi:hypothetical protein
MLRGKRFKNIRKELGMKREYFYIALLFAFMSFYPAYSLEASLVEHKGKLVFLPASGENNSKPQIDCSAIRGVCHRIEADEAAKKHLAYGKRVGLNTIRFWMSPRLFASSGEAYVKKVVDFVRVCHSCGYKVMPILFNGNMLNPDTIMPESYEAADKYAAAFINALKDEPGLLMFDMMNEPLCNPWISNAKDQEKKNRSQQTWQFLRRQILMAKKLAPKCLFTVGYTTAYEIEESTAKLLDVISFHDYSESLGQGRKNYERAVEWGKKLGKQILQTETGCLARANSYEMALKLCNEYNVGWILFNLMIPGRCEDEHGIFYPDGTVRDAGTIAAMFGCFRNRGEVCDIIHPNPNREGKGNRALNLLKKALEKNAKASTFAVRDDNRKELLYACDVAANLLEACELVPMSDLPSAKVVYYRNHPEVNILEVRRFAYSLIVRLKEVCQLD